ncbi:hypothetical protein [Nocardioides panacisoli]|uniref:Right-handed parallel beta-helix repeat-containing protein n=1 Tax=Nocardioides panacisoli TaxID=627624 RepID=A0ABP7ICJ9_9ACTN
MNVPVSSLPLGRVLRLLAVLAVAATTTLTAVGAQPASAAVVLGFVDPATDNYKTWLEDRQANAAVTENATSLLFSGITVGDQTYVVPQSERTSHGSSNGAPVEYDAAGGIPLATSVGGPVVARLRFDHDGANAWSYFRLWPDGTFGPLMTIDRPAFVAAPHSPVAGTFTLTSTAPGGGVLGTRQVTYRYDPAVAALPESSVEWHGPLGRWHLATDSGAPTPLNWPAGIAVSATAGGTHQTQVAVVADQAASLYVAATDIVGLPVPRATEPLDLAWNPPGPGRPTTTTIGPTWRPVSVTVPEGSYALQASGSCASACRYDYQPQALTTANTTITSSDAPTTTFQPDAAIRPVGGEFVGAGTYGAGQTVTATVPAGSSRDFDVRVTNAGAATDTFGLADARAGSDTAFDYTWHYAGADVTSQVHDDGWFVLPDVPVGDSRTLLLTVTAKPDTIEGTTAQYALHAYHSPSSAGIKDVVGLALTAGPPTTDDYVRPAAAPEVPIQPCRRYAAPGGSDDNPGTRARPVLSLHALTAVLLPGETGCLADEKKIVTPEGGSGIMSGGSAGAPKIIRPETLGARATVLAPTKFLVGGDQSDLILKDINLRGSPDAGGGNLLQVNGDRVMLDGVDISWTRNICLGVGAGDGQVAHDFVLIDSRIHDCGTTHTNDPQDVGGAHGAYLQYVADGPDTGTPDDLWGAVVYNSVLDHNDARGLQLYPDVDDALIDHIVLYANGSNLNVGSSSAAERSEGNQIRNSLIADARLDFDDPTDPNPSDSNDVVGNFPGADNDGAGNEIVHSCLSNTLRPGHLFDAGGTGNLVLDDVTENQPPTFVDAAAHDYRLTSESTCQGMGLTDASRLPGATDLPLEQQTAASIGGKLRVGRTLTARPGAWSPTPERYGYRWFLDGERVKGSAGAGRTLKLVVAYRGKKASVRIDVVAPEGYRNAQVTASRATRIR